jgi:fatty acid desaturase
VALALTGPFVFIFPFFVSASPLAEAALWLAVWCYVCRHNYILHNHVHCPFTTSKKLNRLLNMMLGFCTGMTAGNWKITHIHGHHVEHRVENLPSRNFMRYLKIEQNRPYSVLSGIQHSLRTAPLQWLLPLYVMMAGSLKGSSARAKYYRFYLAEFLLVYGSVGLLVWMKPTIAAIYFGSIYSLVYLISRYVDYLTHASSHGSSNPSIANVCLDTSYNRAFWNFGYHVAHHVTPAAHWTTLPALYERLGVEPETPAVAVRPNMFGMFTPPVFEWHRVRDGGPSA